MPYQGESLASFANKVFVELLKTPKHRQQLGDALYRKLWLSQGRRCNLCGCMNAKLEVDHIAPLCTGGSNELENLQIICSTCHAQKTTIEGLSIVEDEHPLLSRFSLETYKAFVESPKPPQLVANMHDRGEEGGVGIDIIRCRFNSFVETDHELPVFAPTDEMKAAVPGCLGDYNWVDLGELGPHQSPIDRGAVHRGSMVLQEDRRLSAGRRHSAMGPREALLLGCSAQACELHGGASEADGRDLVGRG